MASIQETLAKIQNDELRRSSLNFNDAYDTILQEERSKNSEITRVAQELYEKNLSNLDALRGANTRAAIAQGALDSSLAFANASREGLSQNVAGQQLSQGRQATRTALAEQAAADAAARNQQEQQLLNAKDVERQRDSALTTALQANVLGAVQDAEAGIAAEGRLDDRTIASENRGESRTNRLQDKQLERDISLTNAEAKAAASNIDPNVAKILADLENPTSGVAGSGTETTSSSTNIPADKLEESVDIPEGYFPAGTTNNNEVMLVNDKTGDVIILKDKNLTSLPETGSSIEGGVDGDLLSVIGRGVITSGPGNLQSPYWDYGLDIGGAGQVGSAVPSTVNGKVIASAFDKGFGNYVIVQDSAGINHRFSHLESPGIKEGTIVRRGETIGALGNTGASTGPHLDYTVYVPEKPEGKTRDGLDPLYSSLWGRAVGPEVPLQYVRGKV